jgi:hypothetical protein
LRVWTTHLLIENDLLEGFHFKSGTLEPKFYGGTLRQHKSDKRDQALPKSTISIKWGGSHGDLSLLLLIENKLPHVDQLR